MKKLIVIVILLIYTVSFAQSTDLDRETFKTSYVSLPSEPILDDTKRTYSTNENSIKISGFSKVKSPGTLDITYTFKGATSSEVNIEKIVREEKNDEGEVISTTYTYTASTVVSSSASLHIINANNGQSFTKTFGHSNTYKSKEFPSYYRAESHYANNKYDIRNSYKSQQKSTIRNNILSYLNSTYGYTPITRSNAYLWILGSKKHPEFQKHHEAYDKLKAAFEGMQYDEPLDEIKKEVEPVIAYFNSVIPNYEGTKRKMRKVKYASYYNLATIYYYLDMPDKVIEYAQKLIENRYDKKDGERFIKNANKLKQSLSINQTNTRHLQILTEDISNVPSEEKEENVSQNQNIEVNKAYLITKENDTTLVDIKTSDISGISYYLKTVEYDNNGTPFGTRSRSAKNCKEILFVDGLHYKNIPFKESSTKSGALDLGKIGSSGASKLCKVIYESDLIGLYLFNNSELVLLPNGNTQGKSTQAASFVFGFKKNLAKLAQNCPTVLEKVNRKQYKNNQVSLLLFCEELTQCYR